MTTRSGGYIGQRAIEILASKAPDVRITKIVGANMGSVRLAKVHFEDGRFLQVQIGRKGDHTGLLVDSLVRTLMHNEAAVSPTKQIQAKTEELEQMFPVVNDQKILAKGDA